MTVFVELEFGRVHPVVFELIGKAKELANHHTDDNWYQYKRYTTDIAEWQSNVDESQLKTYYDFDVSSVEHSA